MKKILDFFKKHKIATIISIVVLLAAVSLTAVTIALWSSSEDEEIVYTIPTNPAEKYLEYYAMTPNAASKSGYDYYPLSRVPSQLKASVIGLAVARYDGFATEVEIPAYATVTIKGLTENTYPVLHVLRNYSTLVSNGFVNSTVESVILPETITYVEEDALEDLNVYVKGEALYHYEERIVSGDILEIKNGEGNIVDVLVKKDNYYYSTYTYDKFEIDSTTSYEKISYTSIYPGLVIGESALTQTTITNPVRLYGLSGMDNVKWQNKELRENTLTYTMNFDDLFGQKSGYMIPTSSTTYTRDIVVKNSCEVTVNGSKVTLSSDGKWRITYDGTNLGAELITYEVDSISLKLDTEFTGYERYYSDTAINFDGEFSVNGNKVGTANGTYILTYAPEVVFTDLDDVTNYSLSNAKYLLYSVSGNETYTTTVETVDNTLVVFNAISLADSSVNGNITNYNVGFVLPETTSTYYADFGNGSLVELINYSGVYYANVSEAGSVKIYDENSSYESVKFDYELNSKYDLVSAGSDYVIEVKDLATTENKLEVLFDSRLGKTNSSINVVIKANYFEKATSIVSDVTENISLTTVGDLLTLSSSDITNTVLRNAIIFNHEYVFSSFELSVDGVVIYSYTSDSLLEFDFYQKVYFVSTVTESTLEGSVVIEYSTLLDGFNTAEVTGNTITVTVKDTYTKVGKMERNYANTLVEEYIYAVESQGYYIVGYSNGQMITSSLIYVEANSLVSYSNSGYSDNKYSVYAADGSYVTDMVVKGNDLYASLPIYTTPYAYYVVDSNGNVISKQFTSDNGSYIELFEKYIMVNDTMLNSIGMFNDGTSYYANNLYLTSGVDYKVDSEVFNVTEDGYYDVTYTSGSVEVVSSTQFRNTYSLAVNGKNYDLYPTNNPSILVAYVYGTNADSSVNLYNGDEIVSNTVISDAGSYKVYVNVNEYNYYFQPILYNRVFKLEIGTNSNTLVMVNESLANATSFRNTTTASSLYYANDVLMGSVDDSLWMGVVNASGSITVDSKTINNVLSGTYRVFYDGTNISLERIEGIKTYYISINNGQYIMMQLNSANNNYEEFVLSNYSVSADSTITINVIDELGNIYVENKEITLNAGLHDILFALDNQRRKENFYQVFMNTTTSEVEDAINVNLHYGNESLSYYLPSGANKLPEFSSVFELGKHQTFVGWYTDNSFNNAYSGITDGSDYYAKVVDNDTTIYLDSSYAITYEGNVVESIPYLDNTTISFTVDSDDALVKVMINDKVLVADNGVYSFNTKDISLPATIYVYDTFDVKLVDSDGTLIENASYAEGTYQTFKVPSTAGFRYYYDKATGIVYTDATGRLISSSLIDKDLTLTAFYSDNYYVTVNIYDEEGNFVETNSSLAKAYNSQVTAQFPRFADKHYNNIIVYMTTNGMPVEVTIDQYLHTYSFTMPKANVVINITYVANKVETVSTGDVVSQDIYVLVPNYYASDVTIQTSVGSKVMSALDATKQIYQGYVAYTAKIDRLASGDTYFKVTANGEESYVYKLKSESNLYVIENLSLENETCYTSNWISYTQNQNVYTLIGDSSEYVNVYAIHGEIKRDANNPNVITITKAISVDTYNYYQYASFVVSYKQNTNDTYKSFVITYIATGLYNETKPEDSRPILINSDDDFKNYIGNTKFRYTTGKYFLQTADITVEDANGYEVVYDGDRPFIHTYDGQNKTITYIQKDIREEFDNGLFGYIGYGGVVKNFTLNYELLYDNSTYGYETKYYLGSICSINQGDIINVTVNPREAGKGIEANNVRYVGGLVAHNVGLIENCTNNLPISLYNYGASESRILGGIAGVNGGTIKDCTNTAKIIISGETGRESYYDGIVGLDKLNSSGKSGVVDSYSTTYDNAHDYEKDKSGSYDLRINGKSVVLYHNISKDGKTETFNGKSYTIKGEYMANAVAINGHKDGKAHDYLEVLIPDSKNPNTWVTVGISYFGYDYGTGNNVYTLDGDASDEYGNKKIGHIYAKNDMLVDIYVKHMQSGEFIVWVATANVYTLEVTKANGSVKSYPMYLNHSYQPEQEFMTYNVDINVGDTVSVKNNGTKVSLTSASGDFTSVSNGTLKVGNTYGIFNFYYKIDSHGMYTQRAEGKSSGQVLSNQTYYLVVADSWYFLEQTIETIYGTYYFESIMAVDYYKGDTKLGTMYYNKEQTYDHKGMKAVRADVLDGTTKIVVSRVMLISSRETGSERWYYSYDGVKPLKLGNEFTSFPENTYSATITLSSLTDNVAYIYAEKTGNRYATTAENSALTSVGVITGSEVDLLSYADVEFSTEHTFSSYRVKYYNGSKLVAIRSFASGEQIQLLSGITKMIIETVSEGNGVRVLCEVDNVDNIKDVITFYPNAEVTPDFNIETSGYKLSVNNSLQDMYINPNPSNPGSTEVVVSSLYLQPGANLYVVDSEGSIITDVALDTYSEGYYTGNLSINNGVVTVNESTLYDVYYKVDSDQIYIGESQIYQIVKNGTQKQTMYMNTSVAFKNEMMAVGIELKTSDSITLMTVGGISNITDYSIETSLATLSNGVIKMKENGTYNFYLYRTNAGLVIRIDKNGIPAFSFETNETEVVERIDIADADVDVVGSVNYYNNINNYFNGYMMRVYYLTNAGEYLTTEDGQVIVSELDSSATSIDIIEGASKLRIVKYSAAKPNAEMDEIIVNAIYTTKTLTLSNPYYGYYDASYYSNIDDQQGIYFDDNDGRITKVYLNYVLNDGRTGRILMVNNQGKFYVPFDSVIGINPKTISFTYYFGDDVDDGRGDSLEYSLSLVQGDSLYLATAQEPISFTALTEVSLYFDQRLDEWSNYFILADNTYYNLMNKQQTVVVDGVTYTKYVAYVAVGTSYHLTTSSADRVKFMSFEFTNDSITLTKIENGFSITDGRNTTNYEYSVFLDSKESGLLEDFGLFEINGNYFGFGYLAEETTYSVTIEDNQSNYITSGEGMHEFVYTSDTLYAYRNEDSYTVTFVYNGNKERVEYAVGQIVVKEDLVLTDTLKYDLEFSGWQCGDTIYLSDENNQLYYEVNDEKVYLKVASSMTLTPYITTKANEFTVTLWDGDQVIKTEKFAYGKKISSVDFAAPEVIPKDSWFVGWYVDFDKKVKLNRYAVTSDMDIYAKWYTEGIYLVGIIEGYKAWDDQRDGYEATVLDKTNSNSHELKEVYLEAGDYVKLRYFKKTEEHIWLKWENINKFTSTGNNGQPGELFEICYPEDGKNDGNLWIQKSGYYSFYVRRTNDPNNIYVDVDYSEFGVFYSFDADDSNIVVDSKHNYPNYCFDLADSYSTFPLYSYEDARIGITNESNVKTPTLQRLVKEVDEEGVETVVDAEVLKGWYTRPKNGERITNITKSLLNYRNSITLYPEYILGGFYMVDEKGVETRITQNAPTNNPGLLEKSSVTDTFTINFYNGSVNTPNGVSPLDSEHVVIVGDAVLDGNTVKLSQEGRYDFYVTTEVLASGMVKFTLHIEQYHDILYYFSGRFGSAEDINSENILLPQTSDGVTVSSGFYVQQKYGSTLATFAEGTVFYQTDVVTTFAGWTLDGKYEVPNCTTGCDHTKCNQTVKGNATYYIVIDVNVSS